MGNLCDRCKQACMCNYEQVITTKMRTRRKNKQLIRYNQWNTDTYQEQ